MNEKRPTVCDLCEARSPIRFPNPSVRVLYKEYVLPMDQYGGLIATEFGSFDCSSPIVKTLLTYLNEHEISYTAWALWPRNSGGPGGLGACGSPSVMTSATEGPDDFRQCLDQSGCQQLIQPLPWAGQVIYNDLVSH